MLTLGAEYEDTWAPSPDKRRRLGQRAEEESGPAEEADLCSDEPEEPSWRAADARTAQRYDTVLHLDGWSRAGRKDGVRQIVRKHEILSGMQWPHG